jgi:hypothetical protein
MDTPEDKAKAAELASKLKAMKQSHVRWMHERLAWRFVPIPKFVPGPGGAPRAGRTYRAERRKAAKGKQ